MKNKAEKIYGLRILSLPEEFGNSLTILVEEYVQLLIDFINTTPQDLFHSVNREDPAGYLIFHGCDPKPKARRPCSSSV